jgi:hypothetical protein
MFPNQYGQQSPLARVYKHESHKLHQAFPAKIVNGKPVEIISGDLVGLNTDGTVSKYTGAAGTIYIGVAITSSVTPAYPNIDHSACEVTVAVTGYLLLWAKANFASGAAATATYVIPDGTDTDGYTNFKADADPSDSTYVPAKQWINLTAGAAAGDMIQVLCLP